MSYARPVPHKGNKKKLPKFDIEKHSEQHLSLGLALTIFVSFTKELSWFKLRLSIMSIVWLGAVQNGDKT